MFSVLLMYEGMCLVELTVNLLVKDGLLFIRLVLVKHYSTINITCIVLTSYNIHSIIVYIMLALLPEQISVEA